MQPAETSREEINLSEVLSNQSVPLAGRIKDLMDYFRTNAEICLEQVEKPDEMNDSTNVAEVVTSVLGTVSQTKKDLVAVMENEAIHDTLRFLAREHLHSLRNEENFISLMTETEDLRRAAKNLARMIEGYESHGGSDNEKDYYDTKKLKKISYFKKATIKIENPKNKKMKTVWSIFELLILKEIIRNKIKYGENLDICINFREDDIEFIFTNEVKNDTNTTEKVHSGKEGVTLMEEAITLIGGKTLSPIGIEGKMFKIHFSLPLTHP